ncbi:hypothetical protein [Kordia sp.]|uniref:hypothetical protein n=1 Tax=Kordia sp. TaxID=1965332 RepID=UPI0025C14E08|nr:hypothetical protein [Kordia sp.]MCH2196321.1 hypothetical protein [Kordia sp.]
MEKSIEHIWKEGFINNETLTIPKIENLYNQKSQHLGDKIMRVLHAEPKTLLLMAVIFLVGNYAIGNSFWSGSIGSIWCIVWYFITKKQVQKIESVQKETNCYSFLKSLHKLLLQRKAATARLLWAATPAMLIPLIIYTYSNQYEKNFGEIFGVETLNFPNEGLFAIIPLATVFSVVVYHVSFQLGYGSIMNKLKQLISDMESLKQG